MTWAGSNRWDLPIFSCVYLVSSLNLTTFVNNQINVYGIWKKDLISVCHFRVAVTGLRHLT